MSSGEWDSDAPRHKLQTHKCFSEVSVKFQWLVIPFLFLVACSDDVSQTTPPTNVTTSPDCVDNDGDGYFTGLLCDKQWDCDDAKADVHSGQSEQCFDEVDNNCDGQVDENCPTCADGSTRSCGDSDVGPCRAGTQRCVDGAWTACEGVVYAQIEQCNGIDDDCDGDIDEDSSLCDDGLACNGVESCVEGACAPGESIDCSVINGPCQTGLCLDKDGSCETILVDDGTPCDTGLFCTEMGMCSAGECVAVPRDCSSLDSACSVGVCDEAARSCVAQPIADGTTCDDGQFCTTGDVCTAGQCGGGARSCDSASDQCNTGVCDETADACVPAPRANGTSCEDGLFCTINDSCVAGACTGGGIRECSASGGSCRSGVCDEASRSCTGDPVPDGTSCEDGLYCTVNDSCLAGNCAPGAPRSCSTLDNACNTGTCNETVRLCQAAPRPNGTTCDDGQFCTMSDSCTAGACSGVLRTCSEVADSCNNGACSEAQDACVKVPRSDGTSCNDGLFCTVNDVCVSGACSSQARDCSVASNACNVGVCNEGTASCIAAPRPNGTSCNDGQFCTSNDACTNGVCFGGGATDCSAAAMSNPCLIPACNEQTNMCFATNDPTCCNPAVDADLDGSNECLDCNDNDASIRPGMAERCNGVDDDCDGRIDEDFDEDNDGFSICGDVPALLDCNDNNANVNPGRTEDCGADDTGNGIDDNCNGYVDEGCNPCTTTDVDNDGYSECDGDCVDNDPTVFPGAPDTCDGKDNDCNKFTTANCDVSQRCNHDLDSDYSNDADVCGEKQLCACILSNRSCTGDYRCTSFCNSSDTGAIGDGCQTNQTCGLDLRYSANVHGCNVNTAVPGALRGGATCSQDSQCRSLTCEKVGVGNAPKICWDLCTSDDRCAPGSICRITRQAPTANTGGNMDGRCWVSSGYGVGTTAIGSACTSDTACNRGLCTTDPNTSQRYCTEGCCTDSDCGSGYTCSYGGVSEQALVVLPVEGADSCTADSQCVGKGGRCYQGKCAWNIVETTGQCIKDVAAQGTRRAGQACTTNSQCASQFCERDLGICVEPCCADSTCPTGLECKLEFVQTRADNATQARVCVNVSYPGVIRKK